MDLGELFKEFEEAETWEERYELLIDLGKTLPAMSDEEMVDKYRVQGCQSAVWMVTWMDEGRVKVRAQSDSQVVRGLIAVLLMAYQGKTPAEIAAFNVRDVFTRLGFAKHLSQSRTNGLNSMVKRIQEFARQQQAA